MIDEYLYITRPITQFAKIDFPCSFTVVLCKSVVGRLYTLFCLGVWQLLFSIGTALHNRSSSGSLHKKLDGQMTMNIF